MSVIGPLKAESGFNVKLKDLIEDDVKSTYYNTLDIAYWYNISFVF